MRFSDYLIETGINPTLPINESYVKQVANKINFAELAKVFAGFEKLTGNLQEDVRYLTKFSELLEDDNFDPFGYLKATDKINVDKDCVLTFTTGNTKLQKMDTVGFSLPAGYTCPFAKVCKSIAHKKGGKFKSGKSIKDYGDIRCYAASNELIYPKVREKRWRNFDLLKKMGSAEKMAELIIKSIKFHEQNNPPIRILRIHDSGDFYSQDYFDAWIHTAYKFPRILFYAYTKALPLWQKRKGDIPKNLRLIASEGGTHDELINKEGFRKAVIVKDRGEAIQKRLNIDVNDFLAAFSDKDFALLLHGTQSKESGMGSQSKENSKILKDAAKKFNKRPEDIEAAIAQYTGVTSQKTTPMTFRKFTNA